MECHYCERKNLPKEAMLSKRKCTDCFYEYQKQYQRKYQRERYRKQKTKQDVTTVYRVNKEELGELLDTYDIDQECKTSIINHIAAISQK